MYYACATYFTAFGFSIVLYFQNLDNFTSVSILKELLSPSYYLIYVLLIKFK